jgi:hypothetical protein
MKLCFGHIEEDRMAGLPRSYRSIEEFEREEIRPSLRIGFSLDDLEENAFEGELAFDLEREENAFEGEIVGRGTASKDQRAGKNVRRSQRTRA